MRYLYLASLLVSLSGLTYLDYRHRLAWFWNRRVTAGCLLATLAFFLTWDASGILLDVFHTNPRRVSGLYALTPDLPLEEFLFLTLLGYLTLLLWRWRQCVPTR